MTGPAPGAPAPLARNSGKLLLPSVAVTRVPNYSAKFCGLVSWHWFCPTRHVAKMRPGSGGGGFGTESPQQMAAVLRFGRPQVRIPARRLIRLNRRDEAPLQGFQCLYPRVVEGEHELFGFPITEAGREHRHPKASTSGRTSRP